MSFSGKVLLVDDEPHIRKFVGLVVRQAGATALLEAGDGEEALALYQQRRPDLVLLDINMPGMTGLETLRRLKELDPSCVVIMLTSLATRQIVEESLALGAASYIRKDTPREEIGRLFLETVAACLGEGEGAP
mgnify:CR=1 FL=1